MKYTNQQLNIIYSYIGYNFYVTFEPQISQVISATQAIADGGDQPDDTLQLQVLNICTQLQNIQNLIGVTSPISFVTQSSKGSMVNAARGDFLLRKQGRALIRQLCIIIGIKGVRADFFSGSRVIHGEDGGMSYLPTVQDD